MKVTTKSGNVYHLWVHSELKISDWETYTVHRWRVEQARSHDIDASAAGFVIFGPVVGKSMVLTWCHPERGLQLRRTSDVEAIDYA